MTEQLHTEDLARRGTRPDGESESRAPQEGVNAETSATAPTAQEDQRDEGWRTLLGDTSEFGSRWEAIQTGFVDEPRRAVEEADALVARVIQRLADSFSSERSRLEAQWSRGDQVSTEDLRVALQRYRGFFNQLLMR